MSLRDISVLEHKIIQHKKQPKTTKLNDLQTYYIIIAKYVYHDDIMRA